MGYHVLEDVPAAIRSFTCVWPLWPTQRHRDRKPNIELSAILNKQIQSFYDQQAWVLLLKFHEDQQEAFLFSPVDT